ncbi:hypothetical protein QZN08_27100 [Burkholderia multivorans]|uniref:hypothetical protein n=1 Tax=Burkholderia multivorans TaxID=87883 RepID=UPI001C229295|nr:hypothetical protein [Burkholderia multivorans]MBU9434150.1 hypothetical protein [Burkholderia multivorans]MDN8018102.1 hypothetical protein [Burkholderia multivorans]
MQTLKSLTQIEKKSEQLLSKISKGKDLEKKRNRADKGTRELKEFIGDVWSYDYEERQEIFSLLNYFSNEAYKI